MNLEVGLVREFENRIPLDYLKDSNGVASHELGMAYVFIERCISERNIYGLDIWEACLHCVHGIVKIEGNVHSLEGCKLNIDPYIKEYCNEISRVTIHELLHLCGCSEKEIVVDHALNPFGCSSYLRGR